MEALPFRVLIQPDAVSLSLLTAYSATPDSRPHSQPLLSVRSRPPHEEEAAMESRAEEEEVDDIEEFQD